MRNVFRNHSKFIPPSMQIRIHGCLVATGIDDSKKTQEPAEISEPHLFDANAAATFKIARPNARTNAIE